MEDAINLAFVKKLRMLCLNGFEFDGYFFTSGHVGAQVNVTKGTRPNLATETVLLSHAQLHLDSFPSPPNNETIKDSKQLVVDRLLDECSCCDGDRSSQSPPLGVSPRSFVSPQRAFDSSDSRDACRGVGLASALSRIPTKNAIEANVHIHI